ncbi:MAG: phosphoribosylglycinamide formyltransferase [Congregibacter sp.]
MQGRRRIAVLASGRGTNMDAIADACRCGTIAGDIELVLCNRPDAPVLEKARQRGIPWQCVAHTDFPDRERFEAVLLRELRRAEADLILLAGFMRILTPGFIREYYGSLLNIHPSVLPKYPGLNTHQRALDAGDSEAGATVHFVTPELDAGPAVLQARVPIELGDTAESLAERVRHEEHRIYPSAVRWCAEGRVVLRDGLAWMDGKALGAEGAAGMRPELL